MAAKKMAIAYLRNQKGKKKRLNFIEFTTSVNELMAEAKNGFTEDEIVMLVDALVHIEQLASKRFQDILKCIVPRTRVPSAATLNMLQWVFTYYRSAPAASVAVALEWVIGLIEFGLTDEETVHAFYNHLYALLEYEKLVVLACKLIHLITKPTDVYRWRVKKILKTERKYGKKNYTNSLLCLFKSYKPECVPEQVPAMNLQFAFRSTGKMNPAFRQAQLRLHAAEGEVGQKRRLVWNVDQGMKKVRKSLTNTAVPPIDYVHFESRYYQEKQLYSLLHFTDLQGLSRCQLRLDIPCHSMSLLQNAVGFHVIAFGNKSLHSRLSYNLYYTLHRAFVEQMSSFPYEEKEKLLKQIAMLEDFMQQGIPTVSRFLAEYLHMWDGEDFREQIFHLLQWITPTSYSELHSLILSHLHTLFVTSAVEVKCSIITMLGRMFRNMVSVGVWRKQNKIPALFLESQEDWTGSDMLQNVGQFASDLCALGLTLEQGHCLLLHEALDFFETMMTVETEHNLPQWTVMPPAVVYNCLLSRNAVFLARACDMLLKYATVVCPRLKQHNLRMKYVSEVSLLELYYTDFANCLWNGGCFEKREQGYMFSGMPQSHVKDLDRYIVADEALLLKNHFCMLPYIAAMRKDCDILDGAFDQSDLLILVKHCIEEIYNLIEFSNNNSELNFGVQ